MATRIGVDVGGTFTDLVFYDDVSGEVFVTKTSTTPEAPDRGVVTATSALSSEQIEQCRYFLHGTTVGINALLERKGAVVGLLTTAGFRDVLEIRRGDRDEIYNILWKPPAPLVPRRLRLAAGERVLSDGTVERPLEEVDVAAAVERFADEDVEAIAVVFMNAYANPVNELAAEQALREQGFEGDISLSHRVSGEYREYERSSTAVIDAYVRPRVSGYLRRLEDSVADLGFGGELLVTRSGGGAMTFGEAQLRPFETIMSGPVAGAVGAAELCRELGIEQGVTADVGGTSFDTCLIVDGAPQVKYEGRVLSMPLQTPWVDVRSIGAGGGSIAHVDVGGLLRAGPQSAGAQPGPACYGRGGELPTATDAAAVLGMLAHGELAGGVSLDFDAARRTLEPLGESLELGVDELACGILTILSNSMAEAIRSVTVEQGQDPRVATLLAFGGAGPVFATLLATELGMERIVVPNYAGNFSAWGLLGQDVARSVAQTSIRLLDEAGLRATNAILDELGHRLQERRLAEIDGEERLEPALDLRYEGQEHTLTLTPTSAAGTVTASPADVERAFAEDYERTFGHTLDEPVEIVAVRLAARTPLPRKAPERVAAVPREATTDAVLAHSFTLGKRVEFGVVSRSSLATGAGLDGPAIVVEETTTTYVDAGFRVDVLESGALALTQDGEA